MHLTRILVSAILVVGIGACSKQAASQTGTNKAKVPDTHAPLPMSAAFDASAQSPVTTSPHPHNATPLGLEIGVANLAGVKAMLGSQTKLEARGTNEYSGGPMLWSNGDGLGVDGLSSALFIFDKDGLLAGIVMTVPKDPKDMMSKLSDKYATVSNRIDSFMNYGYARLQKGDSVVEIDSPHVSFTMQVRYLSKKLLADFSRMSAEAAARKAQEQTDKL